MKPNHVARAFATELYQPAHRVLVKRASLRQRIFSRHKEWRVHGPPSHDEVHKHAQQTLIVKASPHGKEKLLAPFRLAKQGRRDHIHIKERPMVSDQEDWFRNVECFNMLESVDSHQVVS